MENIKLKYAIIILIIFFSAGFFFLKSNVSNYKLNNNLFGYWKGDNEENPGFEITKDYFIIGDKKLNYKVNGNNITIYYSTFTFNGQYRVEKNVLILDRKGNADTFHRWCADINDICKD